jgi:hypothetical protein
MLEALVMPSSHNSSRLGERIRLVTIHSSESDGTARGLGAYFQRASVQASSHHGADNSEIVRYVADDRAAWTLRNGNQESVNLEMLAFAKWTRDQWLSRPGLLSNCASWIAHMCTVHSIPIRRLSTSEVRAALTNDSHPGGVIDHGDYTDATGDGTHWDVGDGFPFVDVLEMARTYAGGATPAPQPPSAGTRPAYLAWPSWMPSGHRFGLVTGPNYLHGGHYERERLPVKIIQQWLIFKGFVPGVANIFSSWADGVFGQPTVDAVARFQRAQMPGTQYYGQVWADDLRKLVA